LVFPKTRFEIRLFDPLTKREPLKLCQEYFKTICNRAEEPNKEQKTMESIQAKPIDFSQGRMVIAEQIADALDKRIRIDGSRATVGRLISAVIGHSFVDEDLENALLRAMASVAGVDVVNDPDDEDEDTDDED